MKTLLALLLVCFCLLFAGCESSFIISGFEVDRNDDATSLKLADLSAKCNTTSAAEENCSSDSAETGSAEDTASADK